MKLTIQIRPISPDDAERLVELHDRCSDDARYFRFHAAKPRLRACEAEYLAGVGSRAGAALVATAVEDGEERIVADARFDIVGDGDAEAAVLLRDDVTGQGLGTVLVDRLLELAADAGLRRVLFDILPENRAMLALARRVGAQPIAFDGRSVLYAVEVTQ
jgi:RimJ/RimL family protein N-acetyltransferase